MRKVVAFTIALVAVSSTIAQAEMPLVSVADHLTDDAITLIYDANDGNMSVEANSQMISTFELVSASGVLTGTTPDIVLPPFDVHTPVKFFILKTDGIGDTDFGPIAAAGMGDELAADLTLNGSILPAGNLGTPNLAVIPVVPEPASFGLAGIAFLGLAAIRRRR